MQAARLHSIIVDPLVHLILAFLPVRDEEQLVGSLFSVFGTKKCGATLETTARQLPDFLVE